MAVSGCAGLPTLCSRPSFRADRLDFDTLEFSSVKRWYSYRGTVLATEAAHVERLEPPTPDDVETHRDEELSSDGRRFYEDIELTSAERAFIETTDFDDSILVGVLVGSASQSSDPRVTHVVREGRSVHCYVCIRRVGFDNVWAPQARLIRVRDSWSPETVRVTFTNGNRSTETFDSDGTGADLLGG